MHSQEVRSYVLVDMITSYLRHLYALHARAQGDMEACEKEMETRVQRAREEHSDMNNEIESKLSGRIDDLRQADKAESLPRILADIQTLLTQQGEGYKTFNKIANCATVGFADTVCVVLLRYEDAVLKQLGMAKSKPAKSPSMLLPGTCACTPEVPRCVRVCPWIFQVCDWD